jgi:hemin uptake protein HemP
MRSTSPPPQPLAMAAPAPAVANAVLRIDSKRLFAGAQEVQIEHHGVLYRLKQTALGKLILTK